jgi:hypothetical protein
MIGSRKTWLAVGGASAWLALSVGAAGCSTTHTRIEQHESDRYRVISNSYCPETAYEGAVEEASRICDAQHKHVVSLKRVAQPVGMDKNTQSTINSVGFLLREPAFNAPSDNKEENQVEISFRCR